MRTPGLVLLAVAAALSGCANPDRSRELGNPSVAPRVIAQQVCSACHGVTGVSTSPNFPHLAAQVPDYLVAQLKAFRSQGRADPAGFEYMWGLSRGLSDAQIEGLAAYYAGQAPAPAVAPAPGRDAIAAGARLYREGAADKAIPACAACHGERAQGQAGFPRLAGQHADYLAKQLAVFQRGNERPEGAVMQTVAHGMSPQDITNVARYLQSLGS